VNGYAASAALRKVRRVVEELALLPRKLAARAAPKLTVELQSQYARGVDPYGRPWAALSARTLRKHGPPPLTDTGRMRDGTRATAGRSGIVLNVPRPGAFHQVGFHVHGKRVPARRILPYQGMPAKWRAILTQCAREIALEATK
jgi:Phage virion morphogenesis family